MLIEYYEILHRERTQAVGFACNSKLYPMKDIIENNSTQYILDLNEKRVIVEVSNKEKNTNTEIIFLGVPDEILELLKQKESFLLISAEPTNHPEEDAPNFDFICSIDKKI